MLLATLPAMGRDHIVGQTVASIDETFAVSSAVRNIIVITAP